MRRATLLPGLRAGDGVFETVRTYGGRPFMLDRHLERLRDGARAIRLPMPVSSDRLEQLCRVTLVERQTTAHRGREWILRPMVYASATGSSLTVAVEPLNGAGTPGLSRRCVVGISSYPHPGKYLVPPGEQAPVKWLARGPLSHALREAQARGWEEAILRSPGGTLVEGTRSNLLAVVEGRLVAPGPESHALPGITREVVLEEARRLGIPVEQRPIEERETLSATEFLLTSTLLGVVAVDRVIGVWSSPRRRIGPVGAALRRAFQARVLDETALAPRPVRTSSSTGRRA